MQSKNGISNHAVHTVKEPEGLAALLKGKNCALRKQNKQEKEPSSKELSKQEINQLVGPRRAPNQTVTAAASCPKPQGAGDISFTDNTPCLFAVAETPEKCARAAETIVVIVKHCHTLGLVSCRSVEMPTRKTRRQKPPTAAQEDGRNQKTTMGQAPP